MADHFTHFSCLLDVGTPDNAARTLALYNQLSEDGASEDPPSDGFLLSIQPEHGGSKLWMRDDVTGDPEPPSVRQDLRRGVWPERPLGLPVRQLLLAAACRRLRRRRACSRSQHRQDDRVDLHRWLACPGPRRRRSR